MADDGREMPGFEQLLSRDGLVVWRRLDNDKNVPGWRTYVIKGTHPSLNDLVGKTIRRLHATSPLGLFVADDWYWDEVPPLFELADERAPARQ